MEGYAKQVEEFATFGDMSDIQKYLRKSQALSNKLEQAAEKVSVKYITLTTLLLELSPFVCVENITIPNLLLELFPFVSVKNITLTTLL
ncbi:hypothetical protein DPMN_184738 [Dreissena polymorpha]|uniref:Uncharacterized protein n=1 Tax=Dreissena polymorpha TaxID=45954 RepID=A0A9D4I6Q1_DREPO|nr:hypothetical protein DPMN_184738 [Dreissena polymorpha]